MLEVSFRAGADTAYTALNKREYETWVDYRMLDGEPLAQRARELALASFHALGCRDLARVDLRCDAAGEPCFLEVNPLPGLHPTYSDLPILADRSGISLRRAPRPGDRNQRAALGTVELIVNPRVVIAHNPIGDQADASTTDVLAQVKLVAAGLEALGLPYEIVPMPDWQPWLRLHPSPGLTVFNLMESPAGRPEALLGAAAALELLGLPFTGSPSGVLWVTTDKLATRAVLAAEGLPVAPGGRLDPDRPDLLDRVPGPWILKPACEDASLGLEGDPVCSTPEAAVIRARELAARFPGQAVVAETFLPGRELNVSLLARNGCVEVLPVAEIVYEGFPAGMSRVLGYEAKWHEESFAYIHTVRRFPENLTDAALLERAGELARAAWRIFGLRGYARVDLRLDATGEPCILEVNANPCLAADGGFMAAAEKAGLSARGGGAKDPGGLGGGAPVIPRARHPDEPLHPPLAWSPPTASRWRR